MVQVHAPVGEHDNIVKGGGSKKTVRKSGDHRTNKIPDSHRAPVELSRNDQQSLTNLATPPTNVSAFCQAVLSRVLPNGFLGNGTIGQLNKDLLLKKVHQFIMLRRFEGMSLQVVMQGMKVCAVRTHGNENLADGFLDYRHRLACSATPTVP